MIFDSHYDQFRGAVAYARVVDGTIRVGEIIQMMSTGRQFEVTDLGVLAPNFVRVGALGPGDVGCIIASMKDVRDTRVGDTVTVASRPAAEALSGYRPAKPMVYCGLYPVINEEYTALRDALDKLQLNDAALTYEAESSAALGFGYRCGFLGLLHLEIVQERLEREFDLDLITTAPSVVYQVVLTDGTVKEVDNPSALPPVTKIDHIKEPYVKASIMVPDEFVGAVMDVCQDRRGIFVTMEYITPERARLEYELPLAEILMDFFDRLKSRTKGYASLDYEFLGYRESQVVKLDILLNGNPVDALSCIVHQDKALSRGRALAEKLKEVIPRQQFEVPIQAAIGNKIIARRQCVLCVSVLAKCWRRRKPDTNCWKQKGAETHEEPG